MNHDIVNPSFLGSLRKTNEVVLVAVDTAIREQPEKMQPVAASFREGILENPVRL